MAGSLNRAQILGNVGKDPEIKSLNNGSRVANLTVATSESWTDKSSGEKKERTEWHRVTVWNEGLVGVIEKYVRKGSKVMIEGQIQTRKYEQNGVEKYATEIVLQGFGGQLILLGDPKGETGSENKSRHTRPEEPQGGYADDSDDTIPF